MNHNLHEITILWRTGCLLNTKTIYRAGLKPPISLFLSFMLAHHSSLRIVNNLRSKESNAAPPDLNDALIHSELNKFLDTPWLNRREATWKSSVLCLRKSSTPVALYSRKNKAAWTRRKNKTRTKNKATRTTRKNKAMFIFQTVGTSSSWRREEQTARSSATNEAIRI